jgi:uncharacterized phage-like protein YoqJ
MVPPNSVLGVTGHRPQSLPNYDFDRLCDLALACLEKFQPSHVNTGMALGWDQAVATACVHANTPFTAFLPFKTQASVWPKNDRLRHENLLRLAAKVVVVSPGPYRAEKIQLRNEALVDASAGLLALWSGKPSGTANCVRYARSKNLPLVNVWTSWVRFA